MDVPVNSIIHLLSHADFDTFEWDGVEITLYSNGEPWSIRELVDGYTRKFWQQLQDDMEYTFLPNFKVTK